MGKPLAFYLNPDLVKDRKSGKRPKSPKRKRIRRKGCHKCPFSNASALGIKSPKMEIVGRGKKKILIVGESPGEDEDAAGRPFVGKSGQWLEQQLEEVGVDMDRDCWLTNVVQCHPPYAIKKKNIVKARRNCFPRLKYQIKHLNPDLIFALGKHAHYSVLCGDRKHKYSCPFTPRSKLIRGRIIPSRLWNTWVCCLVHPAYILRQKGYGGKSKDEPVFQEDLYLGLSHLNKSIDDIPLLDRGNFTYLDDFETAMAVLEDLCNSDVPVAFDYETSCLSPYADQADVLCVTFALMERAGEEVVRLFLPLSYNCPWLGEERAKIEQAISRFLASDTPKIVQNWQFEENWSKVFFETPVNNVIIDTMDAAHLLDERRGGTGLEFQVFTSFGDVYKGLVDHSAKRGFIDQMPAYATLDAGYTLLISNRQRRTFLSDQKVATGYELFHEASPVLAQMSAHGIGADKEGLEELQGQTDRAFEEQEQRLLDLPFVDKPVNFLSTDDLRELVYGKLGWRPENPEQISEETGEPSLKEAALTLMSEMAGKNDLVDQVALFDGILNLRRLKKLSTTFIAGLLDAIGEDGLIHPKFLLNVARTYRSSSRDPNFQNIPIRKDKLALLRQYLYPSRGDLFLEADYSGAEVRVIAMYSGDRVLRGYLAEDYDFHREWAAKILEKPTADITKEERYIGKNQFVFPLFYGSYYGNIAKNIGVDEYKIQMLEEEFWQTFRAVKDWQESLKESFYRKGYLTTYFGFKCRAPLSSNEIINAPIQATAFHLLLHGLITTYHDLVAAGLRSRPVIQVHDSILIDAFEEEVPDVIEIMYDRLERKRFDWERDVKMELEWKVGEDWLNMEKLSV